MKMLCNLSIEDKVVNLFNATFCIWLRDYYVYIILQNKVLAVLFFTIIPPHSLRTTNLRILPNVGFLIPILYSRALILINDI